ncbi:V-type ATP synthase subunit E [Lutispora sp.]|uniref:V-type ATP synthase subunit E n=1 Tax=Lutispora sp. TaxID=2828727 RepID=UPI000EE7024C|nr:V-type ATP synthase subunit E [Lutispora sp.]MEA4963934.1 V-type ATP synthase subunit E [Lutispora sp.]HCJ57538.1 hypothetical protein [Clostridiaceae bacterium]
MSNLDNLINKILDDAKKEADRIMEESAKINEEIVSSKVNEANEKKKRLIEKAAAEAAMMKDRIISNAELKVRDEKLKAKQEVMDRVFKLSKERLKNLNEDEYMKFLRNNIKTLDLKGQELLIVPENMKSKVKSMGLVPMISDDETVESGFMLKNRDVTMNFSFDSLVDYLREELESEIAQDLFKE